MELSIKIKLGGKPGLDYCLKTQGQWHTDIQVNKVYTSVKILGQILRPLLLFKNILLY